MSRSRGRSRRAAGRIYRTSHPDMRAWGRQATTKMAGIPASIGAQLLAPGAARRRGVQGYSGSRSGLRSVAAFTAELAKREILIEERLEEHGRTMKRIGFGNGLTA